MGTEMITEMVVGGIAYVASSTGVRIIVDSAVQNVDITHAGKVCVWVAKTALSSIVGCHTYETVTHRSIKEDAVTVIQTLIHKDDVKPVEDLQQEMEGAAA